MSELVASTASPYHMSYSSEHYSPVVAFGQNPLFHAYLRCLLVLTAQPYLHHLTCGGCDNRSVQTWNSTQYCSFRENAWILQNVVTLRTALLTQRVELSLAIDRVE